MDSSERIVELTALQVFGLVVSVACLLILVGIYSEKPGGTESKIGGTLVYGFLLIVGVSLLLSEDQQTPSPPSPAVRVGGGGGFQPGYENPALGDDGSFDCAPGQGPVAVAPGDPNGLDGDGDGIGCE